MCVKYGLPAQSPAAQTPSAVVRSRSSTLTCPRASVSTPAFSRPMPSVFGVRPPATRRCVPSIVPPRRVQADGLAGPPLDAIDGGPGQDLDPLVPEELLDRLGHVRVLAVDQRAVPFDDRHAAAEAAEGLRQLEAHVAAAQDDQVLRELVQLQGLDVGQRARLREAGGVVDPGTRPGVDDDGLAAERPGPARVERDLDGLRRDEAPVAHDELRAALPVLLEVHRDQPVHHLPLAVADGGQPLPNRTSVVPGEGIEEADRPRGGGGTWRREERET